MDEKVKPSTQNVLNLFSFRPQIMALSMDAASGLISSGNLRIDGTSLMTALATLAEVIEMVTF